MEALHAFIEAHERVTHSDDYRSDLDPKVTDDITDCIKNAHELLQRLRAEAPVASSVLTAVMAAKVVLNEQRGKVLHLYVLMTRAVCEWQARGADRLRCRVHPPPSLSLSATTRRACSMRV